MSTVSCTLRYVVVTFLNIFRCIAPKKDKLEIDAKCINHSHEHTKYVRSRMKASDLWFGYGIVKDGVVCSCLHPTMIILHDSVLSHLPTSSQELIFMSSCHRICSISSSKALLRTTSSPGSHSILRIIILISMCSKFLMR